MKIAESYKVIVHKLKKSINAGFPISCIGMYDSGVDYIYGLLHSENNEYNNHILIPIYVTQHMSCSQIEHCIESELKKILPKNHPFTSLNNVWELIMACTQHKSIVLVIYIGYRAKLHLEFAKKLLALRFQIGKNLNWILFGTYGLLHNMKHEAQQKILSSSIIPLLPHSPASIIRVLNDYRDWYGKLTTTQENQIMRLSGGNPGLLKSLYQLALAHKLDLWIADKGICSRLSCLCSELSLLQQHAIITQHTKSASVNTDDFADLDYYGYIQNRKVFSPLLAHYLFFQNTENNILLSQSQKKIFILLKSTTGIVSRDQIATALWGKRIQEKYSDWAIDQTIYALRKSLKFHTTGFTIRTKRGQGYALISTIV